MHFSESVALVGLNVTR